MGSPPAKVGDAWSFPILPAFVAQVAVDQLDEVVALFDQAVSARESRAKSKTDEALVERAKKGEARQMPMEEILLVLADPELQASYAYLRQFTPNVLSAVDFQGGLCRSNPNTRVACPTKIYLGLGRQSGAGGLDVVGGWRVVMPVRTRSMPVRNCPRSSCSRIWSAMARTNG